MEQDIPVEQAHPPLVPGRDFLPAPAHTYPEHRFFSHQIPISDRPQPCHEATPTQPTKTTHKNERDLGSPSTDKFPLK